MNTSNYQTIVRLKDEYFRKNYTFTVYDGVHELIRYLRDKKKKTGLVTGASKYRILESVPKSFISQFTVLITSDDINHTKPDPEPYIKAANLLNVEPENCVVLENAPLGIQAGKAAGMFVIALKSTLSECHLSNADLILKSIVDLLKLIKTNKLEVKSYERLRKRNGVIVNRTKGKLRGIRD